MSSAPPNILNDVNAWAVVDLLQAWLKRAGSPDASQWLEGEIDRQRVALDERRLGIAIGLAGRRIGRKQLSLSAADIAAAQTLYKRWRPDIWSTDAAARVALVLATWRANDGVRFASLIDRLCVAAELTEHVACLKGFAVFPAPGNLLGVARAALRSSTQALFEAIACYNPYPADHFDTDAFNQMVLKCVFSELPIGAVVGLDERRNNELVRMIRDLVSERNAAARAVPEAVHRWIADPSNSNSA
jgi:hypothetical protein